MVIPLASSRVLVNTGCFYTVLGLTGVAIPAPHPAWFCHELLGPSPGPKQNLSEASTLQLGIGKAVIRMMQMFLLLCNRITIHLLVHLTKSICSHVNTLYIHL